MLLNLRSLLYKMRLKAQENYRRELRDLAARGNSPPESCLAQKRARKNLGWGPRHWEVLYLDEILLFLFSTGDGLFDGFCFSQNSLSFIQFVAALSI